MPDTPESDPKPKQTASTPDEVKATDSQPAGNDVPPEEDIADQSKEAKGESSLTDFATRLRNNQL